MAKKEGTMGVIKETIEDVLKYKISEHIRDAAKNIIRDFQAAVYRTEKKVMEGLFASIFMLCGMVFIVIALVLIINQQFGLDTQWGLMIMGLVLIIIGLIVIQHVKKTKYIE